MTPADLHSWRIARNLTQEEAAALLGVRERWLRYIEAGTSSHGKPRDRIPATIELAIRELREGTLRQQAR